MQSEKATGGAPLISVNGVTLSYDTGVVVRDLTFFVRTGDYLCVVGENGSGKSTLIKALLALISPREGKITYSGITKREIGYLPQQTAQQRDFPASVYEVVLSGCAGALSRSPFYTKKHRALANANLERLGIDALTSRSYRELSGGQQQRVLLARALCATTKLILLDEPVTGLDPLATSELYALIKRLNREEGITIIMVSHDVSCALHDANMVLHLSSHGAAFFGTADEYRESDVSERFLRCDCVTHSHKHGGNENA